METGLKASAPRQVTMMDEHASKLANLGQALALANNRLSVLLDRMVGPTPQDKTTDAKNPTEPTGVIYVAKFGAERIGNEIVALQGLIERLEGVA